ncbi:MarR family transcriptional regulator [Candidatus Parcubacteria bacterium]|nr:MarR family transcriptional regulator [Candidatus Parcubacteria bacterium]
MSRFFLKNEPIWYDLRMEGVEQPIEEEKASEPDVFKEQESQAPIQEAEETTPLSPKEPEEEKPVETPTEETKIPETPSEPPSQLETQPIAQSPSFDFRILARQAKERKREKRLQKLLEFARKKGKITNDEIEKFLHVSDATATRYAKELVRRGLLKKSGKTKSTYYEPT